MKLRIWMAALVALAASTPTLAQGRTISAGMSADQVRATFGAPATTREEGGWAYWFYHNGCPVRCGSDDVVFFREGRVVAAVLRTSARRFSGPRASDALEPYDDVSAAGGVEAEAPVNMGRIGRPRDPNERQEEDEEAPARVGGIRVEPGSAREGEGGSTIIRRPEDDRGGLPAERPEPVGGLRRGVTAEPDTLGGTAEQFDDQRREREGRVEPNTIRQPETPVTPDPNRRERERRVQPRVVPRP